MMYWWGGSSWAAMTVSMIVFWAVLIALVVWAVRQFRTRGADARSILEERFARGEIDQEGFDRRKAALAKS